MAGGKFTAHNNLLCDGDLYGDITIDTNLTVSGTVTCATLTVSGGYSITGGAVFNEPGAAVDFRVEGDNLPNLLLVDGSADLVYITDAATGGTPPTAPTGGFTTGTLLAVQNNSAVTDNSVVALIAGATSGLSQLDFGDSGDANIGSISYDHATDTFTVTAGATAVATVAAAAVAIDGAVTVNESGAAVDFRIEGDNLPNLVLVDGSADLVYVTDAATGGTPPTAPTGGFTAGTLLAVQNNSAATDNSVVALVAGATSGLSEVDFGDADDANIGSVSYDHATDTMTLTAGTAAVAAVSATGVAVTGTLSSSGIADLGQLVLGTANMALGNGANNDVANPAAAIAYVTGPGAAFGITGIAGGTDGQVLVIINNVAQNMTLYNENAGSAAANRILTNTGADLATTAQGVAILVYHATSARWHVVGAPAELA